MYQLSDSRAQIHKYWSLYQAIKVSILFRFSNSMFFVQCFEIPPVSQHFSSFSCLWCHKQWEHFTMRSYKTWIFKLNFRVIQFSFQLMKCLTRTRRKVANSFSEFAIEGVRWKIYERSHFFFRFNQCPKFELQTRGHLVFHTNKLLFHLFKCEQPKCDQWNDVCTWTIERKILTFTQFVQFGLFSRKWGKETKDVF